MREVKVANRYARALFELAIELNAMEEVKKDAELISTVCNENRDFLLMLRSPVVKEKVKIKVIREIFEKHVHEITIKFLIIITRNKREYLIPEISDHLVIIYKEYNNIVPATITTASALDAESRDKILGLLKKHTKAEIELTEELEEELIGGFILSFSNKQFDVSIRKKIQNLNKEFDINLYIKGF